MPPTTLTFTVTLDLDGDGTLATDAEITPYVKRIEIEAGIRSADPLADCATPGLYRLTLNNADGRFSPDNVSGPYYGQLQPNGLIEIRANEDGNSYTLFYGVTQSFSAAHDPAEIILTCADLLSALQAFQLSLPLQINQSADSLLKLIGSASFRSSRAEGSIFFSGQPTAADTVTINDVTFTFKTALATAGEVLIGTNADNLVENTIDNLAAAVNRSEGAATTYHIESARPSNVTAVPRSTYFRAVQADRPVRYYRLGETSGTTAADVGTSRANGTYQNGVTLSASSALAGDPDKAATFDGANDYVSLPTLNLRNRSFTLEIWFKPSASSPPSQQDVISLWGGSGTHEAVTLRVYSSGAVAAIYQGDDLTSATGEIALGDWNYLVLVYDYAAAKTTLFVNAIEIASGTHGPFVGVLGATGATGRLTLGASNNGSAGFCKGDLDEAALYLKPLSAAQIDTHFQARGTLRGLRILAEARGAWANTIPLSESSSALSLFASTLGGGADEPIGHFSYETGRRIFPLAADLWQTREARQSLLNIQAPQNSTEIDALTACAQITRSEGGLFWVSRGRTLTFKNGDYLLRTAAATPALTLNSEQNGVSWAVMSGDLYNRVSVSYAPRAILPEGVVARARGVVKVPGLWGADRQNPADDLPAGGYVVVRLPFMDSATGQVSGAQSLTLPLEAGVDYLIDDVGDGTGYNYTYNHLVSFTVAVNGSNIEVAMRNVALGPLYIRGLQVRGIGIAAFEPQQMIVENTTSQDAYGRRTFTHDLPVPSQDAPDYAAALAGYLLDRYDDPALRLTTLRFAGQTVINSVPLYSLEIGDVIAVTDSDSGASDQRYLITGFRCALQPGDPAESHLTFFVRRLDDQTYWILGDTTYGVLESTGRLGI